MECDLLFIINESRDGCRNLTLSVIVSFLSNTSLVFHFPVYFSLLPLPSFFFPIVTTMDLLLSCFVHKSSVPRL